MATHAPGAFVVRIEGEDVAVEVLPDGRVRMAGHDDPFTVTPGAEGAYGVSDGTRSWRVEVAGPAAERRVWCGGSAGTVEVVAAGTRRSRPRGHGELAAAPMPGTVIDVAVAVGDRVRAGQVLLTLEAMKMELPLRAPREGTVSAIHCAEGDLVQPGVVLVDLA